LIFAHIFILAPEGVTSTIAAWVGIIAASIAGITAIVWMPYYPVWSLVYVGIAVMVIYGITTHFDDEAVAGV
jgi:hypothetical protein